MRKTVVIVEDDIGLQDQLLLVLKSSPDIECIYTVSTGEGALAEIPIRTPNVVLMDINLPGISGIDCIAPLKKACPLIDIVMLTIYEDTDNLFRALRAGASGYLIKSSSPESICKAIRDVYSGGAPLSSHIARKVVHHFRCRGIFHERNGLSPREHEVLNLLASGYIYREVGDELQIGVETVRSHVKNICIKLKVRNRIEAVARRHSSRY